MKPTSLLLTCLIGLAAMNACGTVRYVDLNSASPTPPYTNWATAATTIQDAVDTAVAGDEILVTNGVYQTGGRTVDGTTTNRVAVDKPLTLRSVNGPGVTVIDGAGAVRCVYLTNDATLVGFTLTNGATQGFGGGGGVACESASAVVANCVVSGNSAFYSGGGASGGTLNNCTLTANWAYGHWPRPLAGVFAASGGGASGSALNNCTLSGNSASYGGGGAYGGTLNNCVLTGNSATDYGGGAHYATLNNCALSGNSAGSGGGAAYGTLNNCALTGNSASNYGGGAYGGTLKNCTLSGNLANVGGGTSGGTLSNCTLISNSAYVGGGANVSTLNNCTLIGNSAGGAGGGAYAARLNNCTLTGNSAGEGGGAAGADRLFPGFCILNNCIVCYNTADFGGANYGAYSTLNYCCTTPLPTNGVGNFTSEPLFVDQAGGNLRPQSNSPCINSGLNAYAPAGSDLDGNPRIVGGTVDVGAYEFQSPLSSISYAWLQGYGLPTDGSADFPDADGDGLNNWQEWRCLTDPTNALSALRLLAPASGVPGVIVSWQSVSGRNYFLERGINLGAQPPFLPLATDIVGQAGTTTWLDTNAVGVGPFFYRVGVLP